MIFSKLLISKYVAFKTMLLALSTIIAIIFSEPSFSHFQEIIPDRDFTDNANQQPVRFDIQFTHPMSLGPVMNMQKPRNLKVKNNHKTFNLLPLLKEIKGDTKDDLSISKWTMEYSLTAPGSHIFYIEPSPYWEENENKMIIHYSKVIIDGYGEMQGWDSLVGLPVEIEPLTRPYSLWVGNAFQGVVKKNGKAVPFAEIEVEWRNDGSLKNVADSYVTQVIKSDVNGTFSYVMPHAGWWGFAALLEADYQLTSPDNREVDVELGGLIWVNAKKMK
jgi:cobalt/nickel transport protein